MSGKDKRGEIQIGEAADAHQGFFCWLFTFAFTADAVMKNKYGPQPPISELGQKKGKRGNEKGIQRLSHSRSANV
jgi:hypothetical protein